MVTGLRLAVLGDPVEHSLSPLMQRDAMEQAGLRGRYETVRADRSKLVAELEGLRRGERDGVNVTMPLKQVAAGLCDSLSPEAERSLSVNTIKAVGGRIVGHSTDVVAVAGILSRWGKSPVLILGAGGSARAALAASDRRPVYLAARRREAALQLASMGDCAAAIPWGTAVAGAIVVNATPLGMGGETLPSGIVASAAGLVDLPYATAKTPAVAEARRLGIQVVDGIEFLANQAAASFTWWTGESVDSDRMAVLARNV
jgi:shikimate dehydrogenase